MKLWHWQTRLKYDQKKNSSQHKTVATGLISSIKDAQNLLKWFEFTQSFLHDKISLNFWITKSKMKDYTFRDHSIACYKIQGESRQIIMPQKSPTSQASELFSFNSSKLRVRSIWFSYLFSHHTLARIFHLILMSNLVVSHTLSIFPHPYIALKPQQT